MEIKLNIPETWEDITLNQWRRLLDLSANNTLNKLSILEYRTEQLLILNEGVPREDMVRLTMAQCLEYFESLKILDKTPDIEEVKSFVIGDSVYNLIDFKDLSLAQWIDGEKYSNIINAHKLLAIFYIDPDNYNERELDKVSKWLDDQPAQTSFMLVNRFFFMRILSEEITKRFSDKMKRWLKHKKKIVLKKKQLRAFLLGRFGGV